MRESEPPARAPGSALAVLLIAHRPGDVRRLRTVLGLAERVPARIEVCDSLRAGLERLSAGGVDLVLLDLALPDAVGLDGLRRLRELDPRVPVIALAAPDEASGERALAAGADDYLVTSRVDPRQLAAAIRHARERRRLAEALRASEERLALALRGIHDGIWEWDVAAGTVCLSPRWKQMLGYAGDELGDTPEAWLSRVDEEDRERLRAALAAVAASADGTFEIEHRMRHRDGSELWVLTRGAVERDGKGRPTRLAGSLTDLTARRRVELQIAHDALHDPLTGLANRTLFVDRLSIALASGRRAGRPDFAVLFLDIDRFKTINDSLGHPIGDLLLVEVARRLGRLMRPSDTLARLGGDEFAVLATGLHGSDASAAAAHLAERIGQELARPFLVGGEEMFAGASIGIALPVDPTATAESLLRDADLAMYRAKAAGRGCYEVFDLEHHAAAVELLRLERELRRAVAAGDFVMHYQPIVSLASGGVVGFEALTRWQHPERGLVPPAHFIAIAEETGLVVPLGWRVLEWACAQARVWQERFPADPPYFMSVNVSGKLFAQDGAVDQVLRILERSGLPPESLRLEVTESVALDHGEAVMKRLHTLQAMGVQLSIDDFGTGYSSLSYLQRFRYDSLKIDRSFVRDIEAPDSRGIIEAILALATHLGIGVVAEGVETGEQLERLRSLGCPLGQGFWFARPLDVTGAEALLAAETVW